jgi:hypothetical protein
MRYSELFQRLALDARHDTGNEPARQAHLNDCDQRTVRLRAVRDRLRSFNFCMGRSIGSHQRRWNAISSPPPHSIFHAALWHLERGGHDPSTTQGGSGYSSRYGEAPARRRSSRPHLRPIMTAEAWTTRRVTRPGTARRCPPRCRPARAARAPPNSLQEASHVH